jgi:aryl-alcohol dehydrogenase-like predicted oxidoreductase
LLQLHCPPRAAYDRPEVFGVLDDLVSSGKLRHYGVSVETVDEGLAALAYPRVQSVQIIFNMFRLKPAEQFLGAAARRAAGIIARVPLASGLLTGRITRETTFAEDDHRHFNRHGEVFDVGETFSGVPLDTGFAAVDDLKPLVPPGVTLAQLALRWTLMWDAVTCTIPGARTVAQARENAAAADLPALSTETMTAVQQVYDGHVRRHVHERW